MYRLCHCWSRGPLEHLRSNPARGTQTVGVSVSVSVSGKSLCRELGSKARCQLSGHGEREPWERIELSRKGLRRGADCADKDWIRCRVYKNSQVSKMRVSGHGDDWRRCQIVCFDPRAQLGEGSANGRISARIAYGRLSGLRNPLM